MFDTGGYASLTTVDLFMAKMKELAVITVHKAVHLRNLYQITQDSDETIRAYVARVTATADMCGMTMKCSCGLENSYRDLVVHQLGQGGQVATSVPTKNSLADLLVTHAVNDQLVNH